MSSNVGAVVMGLAYLAILVLVVLFCGARSDDFAEFSQYWGIFGTLVGVTTGAIPAFFFKQKADAAATGAARADEKATLFRNQLPSDVITEIEARNPTLF